VLELGAGESARRCIEVGDRLELREREGGRAKGALASVEVVAAPDAAPSLGLVDGSSASDANGAQAPAGEVTRLAPLYVGVLSPDRHFRTVMSLLLARRNCSVVMSNDADGVAGFVARESLHVVLVDAAQPNAPAALAALEALMPPVGVVLVADEADEAGATFGRRTLARWGPFGELMREIERADEERKMWSERGACEQL
jgi:hypothetical protein